MHDFAVGRKPLRVLVIEYVSNRLFFVCVSVTAERAGELNSIRQLRQSINKYGYELAAILAWKPASEISRHCFAPCL
jgi:hypothetical protein